MPPLRSLIFALVSIVAAGAAEAQVVEVPPFVVVETDGYLRAELSIAGGSDSSMAFGWRVRVSQQSRRFHVRRFGPNGSPLGPELRLDEDGNVTDPRLQPLPDGGFLATWRSLFGFGTVRARMLDGTATPTGPVATLLSNAEFAAGVAAAALPSGSVVVWNEAAAVEARVLDAAGQPTGPDVVVHEHAGVAPLQVWVTALAGGGFVVMWSEGEELWSRAYDASAAPLAEAAEVGADLDFPQLVASPLGGFALVGSRRVDTHARPSGAWLQRFDAAGAPLATPVLIGPVEPAIPSVPKAAFDPAGRLVVVWNADSGDDPRARVYGPSGVPFGPEFEVRDALPFDMAVATRPDGRLVVGWHSLYSQYEATVVRLCVPPLHDGCGDGVTQFPCERCDDGVANSDTTPDACRTGCYPPSCGDGVIDFGEQCDDGNHFGCDGCDAECNLEVGWVCGDGVTSTDCEEECDDGAGNDDATPDACRTTCRLPSCGDGVLDGGEACEDGNTTSCDGCSAACVPEPGLVCGDGIAELHCGEACDDGNAIVGDGCVDTCDLERIPGGGSPATDCKVAWSIVNSTNVPLYDKKGAISGVQRCVDGDPLCDFDAVAGQCTFHLKVCANNDDSSTCSAGPRLRSWELRSPSVTKAAKRPELAAVRAAFAMVPGAIVGPTDSNVCSGTLAVPIAVRTSGAGAKPGKLTIKSYATLFTGETDGDKLQLVCAPR